MSRRSIENTVTRLVNSEEIKEWVFLFEQKFSLEKVRNSKYMNLYNNKSKKPHYQFIEENEKLNKMEIAEKKIEKKLKKRVKISKKYQNATEKNNKRLMEKFENQVKEINEKIACLRVIIDDKKEEVKTLEEKRCKLLTENQTNENQLVLSKEDREIRNIENEIWKIVLDDYFQDKNEKKLVLTQYEEYTEKFKKALKEHINKQPNTITNNKYNDALLDIIKSLYWDVSRDKLFLKNENIKISNWQDINLNENSIRSLELKKAFSLHT